MDIGLTSVTFRSLDYKKIIEYCKECNISCIEWGSDVHALPGDIETAKKITEMMSENGIYTSSYGSYYRCGKSENPQHAFSPYISTAKALKAPVIRIWAGDMNYANAGEEYYKRIVKETQTLCDMSQKEKIHIAYEYHSDTLTEDVSTSCRLMKDIARENMGIYFQEDLSLSIEENIKTIELFLPYIKMIHVFTFDNKGNRIPIESETGRAKWESYIKELKTRKVRESLLFEFLRYETCEELKKEAQSLKSILDKFRKI